MAEKSVITCDLEGRIETFNKGAAALFGYSPDEIIGKKRVSLFSPGLIVLEHVPSWLKTAREQGRFTGRSVFVRKDGTPFAADIRITPTYKHGEQIGYCGVTALRDDIDPAAAMPKVSLWTRIFAGLVITRAPFLSATLVPLVIAAAAVAGERGLGGLSWGTFALAALGACALHIAANTSNDYYDHQSGADEANNNYFLPFSGGSRAIELGLITPRGLFAIALASLGVATLAGALLAAFVTPWVLAFGVVGAFAAWFYTAPPLKLVHRKGLGELFIGLCFGPLMVGGALVVLEGTLSASLVEQSLWLGVPPGLLTTAILWINQFPDYESDKLVGKRNLVVVLGRKNARYGYLALLTAPFALVALGVLTNALPAMAWLTFLALPLAAYAVYVAFTRYEQRSLVSANKYTIVLQAVFGGLLAVGCLL